VIEQSRREDRPKRIPAPTVELLARAARAGDHGGIGCDAIHRDDGGVRRISGVLALATTQGAVRMNEACAAAFAGDPAGVRANRPPKAPTKDEARLQGSGHARGPFGPDHGLASPSGGLAQSR
jgi:hypothetical protein